MYLAVYGIASHFSDLLVKKTNGVSYVLMFDESLNKEMQTKQLDMHIRMWDGKKVQSRYLSSAFLGHATADDMISVFEAHVEGKLGLSNLIQLSMDGPNVNWAAYRKLEEKLSNEYRIKLVNTGSCGLHTVHNSFKEAINSTAWKLSGVLSSLHELFKDVPARRQDYKDVTGHELYPLQMCSHRWVENLSVCERAIAIRHSIIQYVKAVKA